MMAMQTVARMTAKTSLLPLPMAMKTEVTTIMMPATKMGTRGRKKLQGGTRGKTKLGNMV
jgi:hypothetical protein